MRWWVWQPQRRRMLLCLTISISIWLDSKYVLNLIFTGVQLAPQGRTRISTVKLKKPCRKAANGDYMTVTSCCLQSDQLIKRYHDLWRQGLTQVKVIVPCIIRCSIITVLADRYWWFAGCSTICYWFNLICMMSYYSITAIEQTPKSKAYQVEVVSAEVLAIRLQQSLVDVRLLKGCLYVCKGHVLRTGRLIT